MSNFTKVIDKNVGDTFTQPMWASYIEANINYGVMRPLADVLLGSPAATIDFATIDQNFAGLMVDVIARTDAVVTTQDIGLRVNADAAATDYLMQLVKGVGAAASAAEQLTPTYAPVGGQPGASAAAAFFAATRIVIPHYRSSSFKTFLAQCGFFTGITTGLGSAQLITNVWRGVTAITELTLVNPTGNFVAGTRATLYGLPF